MLPLTFRERLAARATGLYSASFSGRGSRLRRYLSWDRAGERRAVIIGILAIIEKLRPDNAKLPDRRQCDRADPSTQ